MVGTLVSIIIPTYNRAEFLRRAVASAFAQEEQNIEVIVVDDGSSDHTEELAAALLIEYGNRFRFYKQQNSGASAARNAGLELSVGRYIQFLDSDDTLHRSKIRLQTENLLAQPEATVSLCLGWLQEGGIECSIGRNLGDCPSKYLEAFCGREVHIVQTSSPLWKRDFLVGRVKWNPAITLGDDLEFHARCFSQLQHVTFVDEALFTVHSHAEDRLSDFSVDNGRLKSLMRTKMEIKRTLQASGHWNEECRKNMRESVNSLYFLVLQRLNKGDVSKFEQDAGELVGRDWRSVQNCAMKTAHVLGGQGAAKSSYLLALRAKRLKNGIHGFSFKARANQFSRRIRSSISWFTYASSLNAFRQAAVRRGKLVLYVEPNNFHTEIIPGYVSLLVSAGYSVTILHRPKVDVLDALSRLPETESFGAVAMPLAHIKRLLTSDEVGKFDLIFIGSGTLAEKDFYTGSVLDYLGKVPISQSGLIIIEHSAKTLLQRNDRLVGGRQFALRPMDLGSKKLNMLAPVHFGTVSPLSRSDRNIISVVGRLDPDVRDFDSLFCAVRELKHAGLAKFTVQLIGDVSIKNVPLDIREYFAVVGKVSFGDLYQLMEGTDFLLPLLNSKIPSHRRYLKNNTTGTRQLSLGFGAPMIIESEFAASYGFDDSQALIFKPGMLPDGIRSAVSISALGYKSLQQRLFAKRDEINAQSLENLMQFIEN